MEINKLNQRPDLGENTRESKAYLQFEKLLSELSKRNLPDEVLSSINKEIGEINSISVSGSILTKEVKKRQTSILKLVEKELKLVPKAHYRNMGLAGGMSAIGLPIGVVFGLTLGNMAFLGLGLPIGLAIGSAVGAGMDKKAFEEGRQLDVEIKY
ncbi:hypothetical protein [Rufibacter roseolus]|uniref:hypothetical protein n=1 Tax=Rufibacter roseolus TaxID=2817375 RepID=UPI001B300DC1|nr:hypothetical protein [Rufibacter roseolus]